MTNFRTFATAMLLGVSALTAVSPAYAAPCRDAHGRFVKCADAAKATPKRTAATKHATATPTRVAAATKPAATSSMASSTAKPHKAATAGHPVK